MQAQPFNLGRLRLYREQGQVPALSVFVTNSWQLAKNMEGVGAMAIHVKPEDSAQDWSAMHGADVILDFPDDDRWTPLMVAIREAKPRRLRVFSRGELTTLWRGRA